MIDSSGNTVEPATVSVRGRGRRLSGSVGTSAYKGVARRRPSRASELGGRIVVPVAALERLLAGENGRGMTNPDPNPHAPLKGHPLRTNMGTPTALQALTYRVLVDAEYVAQEMPPDERVAYREVLLRAAEILAPPDVESATVIQPGPTDVGTPIRPGSSVTSAGAASLPGYETSREAEGQVIGAVLQGGTAMLAGLGTIIPSGDVFAPGRKAIWQAAEQLYERGEDVDSIAVCAELERAGTLEEAGGRAVVQTYPAELSTLNNAPTHARIVVAEHLRRDKLRIAARLHEALIDNEPIAPLLTELHRVEDETQGRLGRLHTSFEPLSSALADVPAEPDWIWPGYVGPGGVLLIGGRPKVGKTSLLFALLSAIGRGDDFLGFPTRQTGALMLTEERPGTIQDKNRRWRIEDTVDVGWRHSETLEWPELIGAAIRHTSSRGQGILVVDTFSTWAGLVGDAENSAAAVSEAMKPLLVAAGSGLAVIVVHHQRKSAGTHGDAIRGSQTPSPERSTSSSRSSAAPRTPAPASSKPLAVTRTRRQTSSPLCSTATPTRWTRRPATIQPSASSSPSAKDTPPSPR